MSSPTPKPPLVSAAFDWAKLPVSPTPVGERRDFFDAATLRAGQAPHEPHRHPEEELIIVKEGTLEATIDGRGEAAGPGSIFFFASNVLHGLRNVGAGPATYHVIRILTSDTPAS